MQEWPNAAQLDELLAFVAVAEQGSFARAGNVLARDPTVVSKRVSALEERLGVRLLARTTRKVMLTEAGEMLLRRAAPNFASLVDAENDAASHASGEARGTLHLSLPTTFGRLWIAPMLASFLALHPQLRVRLEFSNRYVDLVGEGFDASIRIGALADSSLVVRKLAPNSRLLCASPEYIERQGAPLTPDDLRDHACLGFTGHTSYPDWQLIHRATGERATVRVNARLTADEADALKSIALQGAGIMMCTDWLAARELAAGTLIPILAEWSVEDEGAIFAVIATGHLVPRKTRAFIDWIAERFDPPPWQERRLSSG